MFFQLIGILVVLSLVLCVKLVMEKHAALKRAEQYPGTVTEHVGRRGSKGGIVYALKIEYRDETGKTKRFVTTDASRPAVRRIGDKVTVFQHADGSGPDVLIFEDLFLGYWIWFCLGMTVAGCFVAPMVMRLVYLK